MRRGGLIIIYQLKVSSAEKFFLIAMNVVCDLSILYQNGIYCDSFLSCLFAFVLIQISFIDVKTYIIPNQCLLSITIMGMIHIFFDKKHILSYLLGVVTISTFLFLIYMITKARGIGGGDIKLMACTGLYVGTPNIVIAFFLACIMAVMLYVLQRMIGKSGHKIAFGPYLCAGVWIAMLYGEIIIHWYFQNI